MLSFANLSQTPSFKLALYSSPVSAFPPHRLWYLMMSGEAWLYLLAVLINAVNLFLQVFFTIMYSDLEW